MQLIRGIHNLRPEFRGCVVTIGNFDGVHRGHACLLDRARERAAALGVPTCVVTFEPHSKEYLAPAKAPARLTDLRGKVEALKDFGVDRVLVLRFDHKLAALEPDAFIEQVLAQGLGAHHVVVGHDFAFGKGAAGGIDDLQRKGAELGFGAEEVSELRGPDGEVVGSTAIRAALAKGDLPAAERLLGRPYSLCGRVVRGDQIGTGIGFPTANIHTHHRRLPLSGVFVGRLHGPGLDGHPAAVNIGFRPTFAGADVRVEAYLLDFHGDLYGARVELTLEARLRPEEHYADVEALKVQIGEDVRQTRAHFGLDAGGR